MSYFASVFLDRDADASDALLLWSDPLGADALDCSVDGLDLHADEATELDPRPPHFGFGEERLSAEQPASPALGGASVRGAAEPDRALTVPARAAQAFSRTSQPKPRAVEPRDEDERPARSARRAVETGAQWKRDSSQRERRERN
jgi:hypothetical protein